jgi:EmrB/QacA subfamily drug resistance transporter
MQPDRSASASEPIPDIPASTLSKRDLLWAMSGVAAALIVAAFDSTIVSTSMPRVAQELNGMSLYAWVGTGYFLASAITILIFGRLGDLYGRKPMMLASLAIVGIGSVLAGLSQTMGQLITFRVLQGLGGGMMIATTFTAPADLFPDPKVRVRWMVITSASYAFASGIGPMLGGVVTQSLGWRAAFFITPLAAVLAFVLTWKYFPRIRPDRASGKRIDRLGSILLTLAVGCPLAGLEMLIAEGADAHRWWALGLIVVGLVAGAVLIPVERRVDMPIFPLRTLKTRESRLLNLAGLLTGAIMYVLIFYIPLLLQDVFGYLPSHAGLLMTPLVAAMPIGSILNARLMPRQANPERLMILGSIFLGVGTLLILTFVASSPTWWVLSVLTIAGLGLGFLLPNFTLFMQMLADLRDVGAASALVQTMRALGSALGTAVVGIVIARISIAMGLKIGLIFCVLLCVVVGWLCTQIKMKNVEK